jgi:hypothetical protein
MKLQVSRENVITKISPLFQSFCHSEGLTQPTKTSFFYYAKITVDTAILQHPKLIVNKLQKGNENCNGTSRFQTFKPEYCPGYWTAAGSIRPGSDGLKKSILF